MATAMKKASLQPEAAQRPVIRRARHIQREWLGRLAAMVPTVEQRLRIFVAATLLLIMAAIFVAMLWMCDGRLIYSLDDPYISLSLGWHIGHGHYGINAVEAASPSSSILYPLVLAAFAWASWQEWVPLVVNTAAAVATGAMLATAMCRYGVVTRMSEVVRGVALVVVLCVAIDTVGLVFTGLEHSLHVLTCIVLVLGLARALEDGRVPVSLIVAIVLVPLWRFEGIALAILTVAALAMTRHVRAAMLALAGVAATIAAYMAVMHSLGLPLLPSSVLSKSLAASRLVDGGLGPIGFLRLVLTDAVSRLGGEAIPVVLLTLAAVAHPLLRAKRHTASDDLSWSIFEEAAFVGVVAGTLIAQLLFGGWASFARYEDYAVATGVAGAMVLWHREIGRIFRRESTISYRFALLVPLCIGSCYVLATLLTPLASREIYRQQFQMHRFVVDFYQRPVGVNDLGLVSYRNPNYVLDLLGLGSELARQARTRGEAGPAWLDRLTRDRNIGLVMVYDKWFGSKIPSTWRRVAVLRSSRNAVGAFDSAVVFYATSSAAAATALDALRAFKPHLVRGSSLSILDGDHARNATTGR